MLLHGQEIELRTQASVDEKTGGGGGGQAHILTIFAP